MSTTKSEKIYICDNDGNSSQAQLHSRTFTTGERMGRAGKVLAICLVLAAVTALIPVAHFFLVPAFLLAGPVMAFMKYRIETVLETASGVCTECSQAVDIELDPADKLPKWTYCPACNKPLHLVYHVDSSAN